MAATSGTSHLNTAGISYPDLIRSLAASFPSIVDAPESERETVQHGAPSAPPVDVDEAIGITQRHSFVQARNDACPFCKYTFASASRTIAVLKCGHAYHRSCGRLFLQKPEGQECTYQSCHMKPDEVMLEHMREAIMYSVQKGDFNLEDLNDPQKGNVVQIQISEIMRKSGFSLEGTVLDNASKAALHDAEMQTRTITSYRERWEKSTIAKEGFNIKQRYALLGSYMNPVDILRSNKRLTMLDLYSLEEDTRKKEAAEAGSDASKLHTMLTTDEPTSTKIASPDASMRRRMPLGKLLEAGIRVTDIYFQLGVTSWNTLREMGLNKEMLSDRNGAMPLVPLMDLYDVKFDRVQQDLGIIAVDLVRARISAEDLRMAHVSYPLLHLKLGLTNDVMASFKFTPYEWSKELRMDKKFLMAPVRFGLADFQKFGWTPQDLQEAFDLTELEMRFIQGIPNVEGAVQRRTVPVQTLRGPVIENLPVL